MDATGFVQRSKRLDFEMMFAECVVGDYVYANKYDTMRYTFATGGYFGSTARSQSDGIRSPSPICAPRARSTHISYFAPAHLFSMFQTGLPPEGKEGAYFLPVTIRLSVAQRSWEGLKGDGHENLVCWSLWGHQMDLLCPQHCFGCRISWN